MKVCTKCDVEKHIDNFSPMKRNHDGSVKYRNSWCKCCKKAYYRKTSTAPRKIVAFVDNERSIKECLGCKIHLPFSNFTKSTKGSGGIASYCTSCMKTKYYDKGYSKTQSSRWRRENSAQWKAYHRISQFNRISKIKAVSDGTVTKEFACSIYETESCYWCKRYTVESERTMEHIIELSSGGKHSSENITMACRSCNSARFNRGVKNV